ncbi:hypothetical protein BMS3Abin03_03188 [bacterium BMS3Abin03]|nr:hypothetical protein BMS3Abin03_03188 [bacterium BMS3Abin03]
MKKYLILTFFFILLSLTTITRGQSYHTVTFTGNPATDFNVAESHNSTNSDVTWYFTWDATNIYLGLSATGGTYVKDQPSIVYFDSDPTDPLTNGTGSTLGSNYDGRTGTYPFTANFVVFFKTVYAEYRINTSGTWGTQTDVTSKIFTTTTNAIEIYIPWSDFPNSVKPNQLYYLMYKEDGNNLVSTGYAFNPLTNRTDGDDVNTISNWSYFSANSTGSGQTPFSGEDTPLPVELTSFTASTQGSTVTLNWKTATEVNNYGFEILRSTKSDNWTKIGFVEGNGNSNSPKSYSFTDENLARSSKFYYRLKQIDNDGQFEYSNTIEVDLNIPEKFVLEQNYPNPFNPSTTIRFAFEENTFATLKIYNAIGEEVAELFNGTAEAGRVYSLNFDASKIPSGIYLYKLNSGKNVAVKKMILLK